MNLVVIPEGKIVILEHLRSENVVGGKILFDFPFTVRMIGVNVNRKTIKNIEKAGLKIDQQKYLIHR